MKNIFFLIVFLSISCFAQKTIHNYEYAIIAAKFDFVNKPDKYQTSSLTKFLFKKNGFEAFLDNENLPQKVSENRCLALTVNVISNSTMFITKNTIELRDCNNKLVFSSSEGLSRKKEYKEAYHEAIRSAFKSVEALKYVYKPVAPERKKEKIREVTSQNKKTLPVVVANVDKDPNRKVAFKKAKKQEENDNPFGNNQIPVLYATATSNGYQLLNIERKSVFNLLKTNLKNVFIIKDKNGILYKENNIWIADFYNPNGNKVVKQYDVKIGE